MGQQVAAIVYGVETKFNHLRDADGEWLGGGPGIKLETGDSDNFSCIALPLAVQNVAEDGEADLPEGPLDKLSGCLCVEIASARRDWKQVVKWAKKHGMTLPKPGLILVMIERA